MPAGTYAYYSAGSIRGRALLPVTGVSGGVALASGDVASLTIKNLQGNGDMFVGGTGSEAPNSGIGFLLSGGEGVSLTATNFNKVQVFATTSGQVISYFGVV